MKLNILLFTSLLVGFLFFGNHYSHPEQESPTSHTPASIKQHPKLDSTLSFMVTNADHSFPESEDQVQVTLELYTTVDSSNPVLSMVQKASGQIQTYAGRQVQALVPKSALINLGAEPSIAYIHQPNRPYPDTISLGVPAINAVNFRLDHNTEGTGVKIAVLDQGFAGYPDLQASGELTSTVIVRSFRADGIIDGITDHGTACAEIIYDIAPGAEYYFVTYDTSTEFVDAVEYLVDAGVHIVSHSLNFFNLGPYDGTSAVSENIDQARQAGIFWVNSAGDYTNRHWEGEFPLNDGDNYVYWDGASEWINEFQNVEPGEDIIVYLSWNEWSAPNTDIYLFLYYYHGDDWDFVSLGNNVQDGSFPPIESINFTSEDYEKYGLVVYYSQIPPADLYLELFSPTHDLTHSVPVSSIPNAGDAVGAFTVGAVSVENYEEGNLRSYSSQGPTNSSGGGEPDYDNGSRIKPDIVAPDGVATETYSPFSGTSASAPHAAGAAALFASSFLPGDLPSPELIQEYLESCADYNLAWGEDIVGIKNNEYGAGGLFMCEIPTVIELQRFSASGVTSPWATILLTVFATSFLVILLYLFGRGNKSIQKRRKVIISIARLSNPGTTSSK